MTRTVDILMAVPFMFVLILVLVMFGKSVLILLISIGLLSWPSMARIVRGQTLSLKQKEFIEAARAAGVGTFGIIRTHLVHNVVGPVIV